MVDLDAVLRLQIFSHLNVCLSSIFYDLGLIHEGFLYALCTSWPPFGLVEEGGELDPLPEGCSPQLRALIERCMAVDPRARPNALEVLCEAISL